MPKTMRLVPLLAALALCCAVLTAPGLAGAYCVYNHTDATLRICGGGCISCLAATVEPGGKACCPGGDRGCSGGKIVYMELKMKSGIMCSGCQVPVKVDAHGWVSIHGTCNGCAENKCFGNNDLCSGMSVEVYDADGKKTYGGGLELTDDGC